MFPDYMLNLFSRTVKLQSVFISCAICNARKVSRIRNVSVRHMQKLFMRSTDSLCSGSVNLKYNSAKSAQV